MHVHTHILYLRFHLSFSNEIITYNIIITKQYNINVCAKVQIYVIAKLGIRKQQSVPQRYIQAKLSYLRV